MHTHEPEKAGSMVNHIQIDQESDTSMMHHLREHHGMTDEEFRRPGYTTNDIHDAIQHHRQDTWKNMFHDRRGQNVGMN